MTLDWDMIVTCMLIVLARIGDVTLGTLRLVAVVHGRRALSVVLGFLEVLVWVLVVSRVILTVQDSLVYALAYALGFALGNYIGITIESRIAFGTQVVRVFTRRGAEMVLALRQRGHRVTEFTGCGRDGPVSMLFIEIPRRSVRAITSLARSMDPECYYIVDDVRVASTALPTARGGGRRLLSRP